MNPEVQLLIPAIVSFVNERGGAITKTKLLKLLYLFDIEYYRIHGRLFTGFDWKFYHLGPWTAQFDSLLDDLVEDGAIIPENLQFEDYEVAILRTEERVDLDSAIPDIKAAIQLNRILMDWGTRSTGELLDHVYFRTEPMENGIRNERLDFSSVPRQQLPKYRRTSSETKPGTIAGKKREYQARLVRLQSAGQGTATITPAKYDDEFFEAIETMERQDSCL